MTTPAAAPSAPGTNYLGWANTFMNMLGLGGGGGIAPPSTAPTQGDTGMPTPSIGEILFSQQLPTTPSEVSTPTTPGFPQVGGMPQSNFSQFPGGF